MIMLLVIAIVFERLLSMISATAANRASRALRSKTRQAVQVVDYLIGDQIEFWKQPSNKDP
eukprot:3691051-Prorocentrum_lima.AAC.1